MKTAIVYASVHHGNTKKVIDSIAEKYQVDLIDATTTKEADLSQYELIGYASGIYAGSFHRSVLDFAEANMPNDKKTFFVMTSAMNKDHSKSIEKALAGKNADVLGYYTCKGYNTFGPFKLVGGTGKGHPDAEALRQVVKFYESITEEA